jgi:hypothetical protein
MGVCRRPALSAVAVALVAASSVLAGTARASAQTLNQCGWNYFRNTALAPPAWIEQANNWGGGTVCLNLDVSDPAFSVAQGAGAYTGKVLSYPDVRYGCWAGAGFCTASSGMPVPMNSIGHPSVVFDTSNAPAAGTVWDTSLDMWFGDSGSTPPSSWHAEVMVWTNGQNYDPRSSNTVWLGGDQYYVTIRNNGTYIQFSRVNPVDNFTGSLQPFLSWCLDNGYLQPSWSLWDIDGGFELWAGGAGLGISDFTFTR